MTVPAFLHPFSPPARAHYRSIERGEGAFVFDRDGRRYIDGMGALWYANLGHGHPRMLAAISEQAQKLAAYHCFAPFTNAPADALADRLAARAPMPGARVFFTSSGSEAVDAAIKIARIAHEQAGEGQRDIVISRVHGYHGVTYGGTSAQGLPPNQAGFGPLVPGVVQVPHDDLDALRGWFEREGDRIAAVLTEPLQGAGGVYPPPPGYLAALRRLCDEHGAFLILDEVICGFGRLGHWFGCQAYDLEPDMVTFAKAVTGGYVPLGGVLVGEEVREPLEADPSWVLRHGHTYSGHPLACAAGLACVDILEEEDLLPRATEIGARLREGLEAGVSEGWLADARGDGAVWAAVLHEGQSAADARDALLEEGVILRPLGGVLAICPPLVIDDPTVDQILSALRRVLQG